MLYRTVNYLQHVREGWGGLRTIMAQTAGRCRLPAAHANCAARVHAFRYTHVRHTHTHTGPSPSPNAPMHYYTTYK